MNRDVGVTETFALEFLTHRLWRWALKEVPMPSCHPPAPMTTGKPSDSTMLT